MGTTVTAISNIDFDDDAGTVQVSIDGIVSRLEFDVSAAPGGVIGVTFGNYSYDVLLDTDEDGVHDQFDLDSDNDGISDLIESGADPLAVDTNNDGVYDSAVTPLTGIPVAANGGTGVDPVDSDNDGINDFIDLDSDDDGIADAIEAQPTTGYTTPAIGSDADNDGAVSYTHLTLPTKA